MKYRGNKALMKCCKTCKYKKRIRCLGTSKIYRYQGYKFCTECTRPNKVIEKRLEQLKKEQEFNKRIKYIQSKDNISKFEKPKINIHSQIELEIVADKNISKIKRFLIKVVRYFGSKEKI